MYDYKIPSFIRNNEETSEQPQMVGPKVKAHQLSTMHHFCHAWRHPSYAFATSVNQSLAVLIGSTILILIRAANVYAFVRFSIGK